MVPIDRGQPLVVAIAVGRDDFDHNVIDDHLLLPLAHRLDDRLAQVGPPAADELALDLLKREAGLRLGVSGPSFSVAWPPTFAAISAWQLDGQLANTISTIAALVSAEIFLLCPGLFGVFSFLALIEVASSAETCQSGVAGRLSGIAGVVMVLWKCVTADEQPASRHS